MDSKFLKKASAAALSAMLVSGSIPSSIISNPKYDSAITVKAAEQVESTDVDFDLGEYNAKPGDTVELLGKIDSHNNPICYMKLFFNIDSPIELADISPISLVFRKELTDYSVENKSLSFLQLPVTVPKKDGVAFTLYLKVPEDCPDGDYTVSFDDSEFENGISKIEVGDGLSEDTYKVGSTGGIIHVKAPEKCTSFDEETGVLTLKGDINKDEVQEYANNTAVKKVVCENTAVFPADCTEMFYNFRAESVDLSAANTSSVDSMNGLFLNCSKATSITLGSIDTSNVTNMKQMFASCSKLETLDVSKLDTTNVQTMYNMFDGCSKLKSIDISDWNTSKVTDMYGMFAYCRALETFSSYNIDTSNVRDMSSMFMYCDSLETLNLSSFNTSSVTNMSDMFSSCSKLKTLDLRNFNTSKVKKMTYTFGRCSALEFINLSSFDTSNVTDMSHMFRECTSLKMLDLSSFNTENVTMMYSMFSGSTGLTNIIVSDKWTTGRVTNSNFMFEDCTALKGEAGTTYDETNMDHHYARIDRGSAIPGYFSSGLNIINGASMTLDGNIGVNFYVDLSDSVAKAVLSGPNGDVEITDFSNLKQSNGSYKLTYEVHSTQADENISLKLYNEYDKQLIIFKSSMELDEDSTIDYSVNEYINNYVEGDNPHLNALVSALDNYCKSADNYFNAGQNTINGIADIDDSVFTAPVLCGNKLALVLNSQTAIRIYYEGDVDTASLDGFIGLDKVTRNGSSYFEITNVPADKLADEHTLAIGNDVLKFSALSYGYLALNKTTDEKLWNVVKSLYVYAKAADAYRSTL